MKSLEQYIQEIKSIDTANIPDNKLFRLRSFALKSFEKRLKKGIASNYQGYSPEFSGHAEKVKLAWEKYDQLAMHYATMYRGGYLLNYFGFSVAIFIAAGALALLYTSCHCEGGYLIAIEAALIMLGISKVLVIMTIIRNSYDIKEKYINQKHIDFRYVAERLRVDLAYAMMEKSNPIQPVLGGHLASKLNNYSGEVLYQEVRSQLGSGDSNAETTEDKRAEAVHYLISDQYEYHADREKRHELFEHKLERLGEKLNTIVLVLVCIDIAIAVSHFVCHMTHLNVPFITAAHSLTALLIFLTIVFPALVGTLTGIAAQSEYYKLSSRNKRLKEELGMSRAELQTFTQDSFNKAAQMITDEVAEWTLIYEKKVPEL
jgi:hypothetical protein